MTMAGETRRPGRLDSREAFADPAMAEYNRRFRSTPGHRRFSAGLGRALTPLLSGRVLDIGSSGIIDYGTGALRLHVSCDISPGMLRQKPDPRTRRVCGDSRALPFPGSGFDTVLLMSVLHHVTGTSVSASDRMVERCLAETARVLAPGGSIIVVDVFLPRAVELLWIAAFPLILRLMNARRMSAVRFYSRSSFTRRATLAGLAVAGECAIPLGRYSLLPVPRLVVPHSARLYRLRPA